jgi:hypothetical protein
MNKTEEDGIPYCHGPSVVEAVDLNTVECVIGRVRNGNTWGIVDQCDMVTEVEC